MLNNIRKAALFGLKNDACGLLNTDWGDNGHWQQLPISYPGLAAGAAQAWCLTSNQALNLAETLNKVVLYDESGILGSLLLEIGNLYKAWRLHFPNSSPLFWLLQEKTERLQRFVIDDPSPIYASLDDLSDKMSQLDKVRINRLDGELILNEITLTITLLQHACKRALSIHDTSFKADYNQMLREIGEIRAGFTDVWLKRNRPGGLADSLARFDTLINAYQSANE
jgi:hypothetical protein